MSDLTPTVPRLQSSLYWSIPCNAAPLKPYCSTGVYPVPRLHASLTTVLEYSLYRGRLSGSTARLSMSIVYYTTLRG